MDSELGTKGRKRRPRNNRNGQLSLTRRSFVAGMATVPLFGSANAETASVTIREAGLQFQLSEDQKQVSVVLLKHVSGKSPADSPDTSGQISVEVAGSWDIPAHAFGPDAWFDIDIAQLNDDAASKRNLIIRNVSFGPHGKQGGRWLSLVFEKKAGTTAWTVIATTNLLSPGAGTPGRIDSQTPIPLIAIVKSPNEPGATSIVQSHFEFVVPVPALSEIMCKMSGGHLQSTDNGSVRLSTRFVWSLRGKCTSVHNTFVAENVCFLWLKNESGSGPGWRFALLGGPVSLQPVAFGDRGKTPQFALLKQEAKGSLVCYPVAEGPVVSAPVGEMAAFVRVGKIGLEAALPNQEAVSEIALHDVVIGKILQTPGAKPVWRTAIWADAANEGRGQPLQTPIGWMSVTRLQSQPEESKPGQENANLLSPLESVQEVAELLPAVLGNRAAIKNRTFYALADNQSALHRFSIDAALLELDTALPDASHSELKFQHAHVRLFYSDGQAITGLPDGELAIADAPSHVWLGEPGSREIEASIDLLRSTLDARRQEDLVDLRFRFADLVLVFANQQIALRPRTPECRVMRTEQGDEFDNRPLLSVEFGPQHVMEQAFYMGDPPPLPDVNYARLEADLAALAKEKDLSRRVELRQTMQDCMKEKDEPPKTGPFSTFAEKYQIASSLLLDVPDDQRIYIGPRALDPDSMLRARNIQRQQLESGLDALITKLLDEAAKPYFERDALPADPGLSLSALLERERQLEGLLPLYMLWRDIFRDTAIAFIDAGKMAAHAEYVSPGNSFTLPTPEQAELQDAVHSPPANLLTAARQQMVKAMTGTEEADGLAMARLAGSSRLAFRINCAPTEGDDADINGFPDLSPGESGAGGMSFARMDFSLEALTDWSHHEPAVTRRARKFYKAAPSGILPPAGERAADLDDRAVLLFQGIEPGEKTSMDRMAEVRAALQAEPEAFETAIEIPARLILSTAQDAVWQTSRRLPHPETADSGGTPATSQPLWSARLLTHDVFPSVRAVASRDLRPSALMPRRGNKLSGAMISEAAPPRGPYAPWMLSRAEGLQSGECGTGPDAPADQAIPYQKRTYFDWLCDALMLRPKQAQDRDFRNALLKLKKFRSTLDAYDRHELVLLTSAYGLPVTGKREQVGNSEEEGGKLKENAGQFEPGPEFMLYDARPDQAIYRPKPLDVEELNLTALGGSLVHDTSFAPPMAADDYDRNAIFDGLSIERWQHHTVLGRDILATVVYSGYLFPLSHKASLVKVSERIFVKVAGEGVKAILRQRMFVRVSNPTKFFPAVGQPNGGRQWCSTNVTMLTRQTPDIVDPTYDITSFGKENPTGAAVAPNGRINLQGETGLAFWPQTSLDPESRIKFEFMLDGRPTRMPLIFVDRVGVRAKPLAHILAHYRDLPEDLRKMAMAGQSMRYADAREEGDTSFATEHILVNVDGRRNAENDTWQGDTSNLNITGVLEGADQPPFYPNVEHALIRIEQIEQLSGGAAGQAKVQFDGHYVRHGFASMGSPDKAANQKASENAAEAFLVVHETKAEDLPKLSMGENGNQSGGVARPELFVVGLSRLRGPLGAAPSKPDAPLEIYQDNPSLGPKDRVKLNLRSLNSIVHHFAMGTKAPTKENPHPENDLPPPIEDVSATYEMFFSQDAKLLGVISFKDLMKLLRLAAKGLAATASMPLLQEAVEYGVATAENAEKYLKKNVLLPLKELLQKARKQWRELDSKTNLAAINEILKDQIEGGISPLTLLFPEIEAGLTEIEEHIDAALAEEDVIAFPRHLGKLHSAVRRFIKLLAALARNAPDRIGHELLANLTPTLDRIESVYREINKAVSDLKNLSSDVKRAIMDLLVRELTQEAINWILASDLPVTDLLAFARTLENEAAGDRDLAGNVLNALQPKGWLSGAASWQDSVKQQISGIVDDPLNARTQLQALLRGALESAVASADKAQALVTADTAATDLTRRMLSLLLAEYREQLVTWQLEIKSTDVSLSTELSEAISRLESLCAIVRACSKLRTLDDLIAVAAIVARQHLGFPVNVDIISKPLQDLLKELPPADKPLANLPAAIAQCRAGASIDSSLLTGHWLENFAKAVNEARDADLKLEELDNQIKTALSDGKIPDAAKPLVGNAQNTAAVCRSIIARFRRLFCISASATWKMQELPGLIASAASDVRQLVNLATKTAKELAAFMQEAGSLFTGIADDLAGESKNLLVASLIALLGKLAKESGLPSSLQDAATDANAKLVKLDEKLSGSLRDAWNLIARVENRLRSTGSAYADQADVLLKAVGSLPALLNLERDQCAKELNAFLVELGRFNRPSLLEIPVDTVPFDSQKLRESSLTPQMTVAELLKKLAGNAQTDWEDELKLKALITAQKALAAAATALLARIKGMPQQLTETLLGAAADLIVPKLAALQGQLITARGQLFKELAFSSKLQQVLLVRSFSAPAGQMPSVTKDKFHEELDQLNAIKTATPDLRTAIRAYVEAVEGGKFAVLQVLEQAKDLAKSIVRGEVLSLIDIAAFRDEIEDLIADILPVKRRFSYDLGFDFDAERIGRFSGRIFDPKPPGRFELKMDASYNLLDGTADMKSAGSIGPFDINLIGDIFKAVTLKFDGMDFRFEAGGSPRFDVHYNDFVIGKQLQFVQKLQQMLKPPKDGNGFFIQAMKGGPGIEAGYGLNLGTVQLGGMAFSNISLNASAGLPFNRDEALFKFSLGRQTAPFLVSVPPFGGGAYVAILANADGFRGFEASIEFGGVADFSTGPLVAAGRITSGFYISSLKVKIKGKDVTITRIGGTFYAGGDASIWIFSFHASLYVTFIMDSESGEMTGTAIFTFSFNMGLVDYDYRVRFSRKQKPIGGGGGARSSSEPPPPIVTEALPAPSPTPSRPAQMAKGSINAGRKTKCQTEDLHTFLNYYDMELV